MMVTTCDFADRRDAFIQGWSIVTKLLKLSVLCICIGHSFWKDFLPSTSDVLFISVSAHPVSLSEWNSCLLDPLGAVHCWSAHNTRSRKLDNVTQIEANLNQSPPEWIRAANFTSIRGGRAHTCGIVYPSSRLVCWGSNLNHQLEIHPLVVNQSIQEYDVGDDFTCAQLSESATQPGPAGGWFCWGRVPSSLSPFADNESKRWTAVVAGIGPWLCTLQETEIRNQSANTTVKYITPQCIGESPVPPIGDGEDSRIVLDDSTYLLDWAVGSDFLCVLLSDHSQRCYGSNEWGAFNLAEASRVTGNRDGGCQLLTAAVGALCCLLDDGSVLCAGRSLEGQTNAPKIGVFTDIVCRFYSCCSVTSMGFINCWGDQGDLASQFAGPRFMDLNAGVNQMLAQLPSGRVIGWGDNSGHQLDIPDGITDWIGFSTSNDKSCGVRWLNNQIICWGNWAPPSASDTQSFTPPPTGDAALGWRTITVGLQHACGILVNGNLSCFGSNTNGQTNIPQEAVAALAPIMNCDASMFHTCCVGTNGVSYAWIPRNSSSVSNSDYTVSGNALCFGSNEQGQLHIPWVPFDLALNLTWLRIAVGTSHSVGLLSNGSMRAWGQNVEGQCNVPTQADIATNPQLQDLDLIDRNTSSGELLYSDPHAGAYHSCGILMSKRVVCFGYNLSGQAGNPFPFTRFTRLNLAGAFTAGIEATNHTLLLWGANNFGQLQPPIVEVLAAPVGFYRTSQGELRRCSSATFSLGMGASGAHCSGVCAPGRYGGTDDHTDVTSWRNASCAGPCFTGHACPAGTSLPISCSGYAQWQSLPGQSSCDICATPGDTFGAYVDSNRTHCGWYWCPGGQGPSANGCQICPPGQAANTGPDPCRNCTAGTYNFLPQASQCIQCTSGSAGEGLDCSRPQAQVKSGFWALRLQTGTLELYACAPDLCDGDPDPFNLLNPCSEHRSRDPSNILCGKCDEGYSYWNEACVECSGVNYGMIFLLLLSSFLFVALLHALMNSSRRRTRATSLSLTAAVNSSRAGEANSPMNEYESESASAVDVALNFGQASWIQFHRSFGFQTFLAFLSFDQRGTTGSMCLAPLSAVANLASPAAVPVVLFAELFCIAFGQACAVYLVTNQTAGSRQLKDDSDEDASISLPAQSSDSDAASQAVNTVSASSRSSYISSNTPASNNICLMWLAEHCQKVKWHNYMNTAIVLLTFSFQQTVRVCLRYLKCDSVGDQLVVYTAPAIDCHSHEYMQWMPLVIIILTLELGFFVALVAVVMMKYKRERSSAQISVDMQLHTNRSKSGSLDTSHSPAAKSTQRKSNITVAENVQSLSASRTSVNLPRLPSQASLTPNPVSVAESVTAQGLSDLQPTNTKSLETRFRVLFAPYSSHAYYWCVWDMFRRTALILIDTFLLDHQPRSLALVYFNMLCLVVQLIVRPYVSTITNRLEVMSLSILVVLSVAILSSPTTVTTAVEWLLIAGVMSGLVVTVFFVLVLYSHQWEDLRPQMLAPVLSLQTALRSMLFGNRAIAVNLQKRERAGEVVLEMQPPADSRTNLSEAEDDIRHANDATAPDQQSSAEGDHDIAAAADEYGRRPMSGGRLSDTIETLGSNREQPFLSNALSTHQDAIKSQSRPSVSDAVSSNAPEAGMKKVHFPTFNDDALMASHPTALRFSDATTATRNGLFRDSISIETLPTANPEEHRSVATESPASVEPVPLQSTVSDLLPASHLESDPTLHTALRDHGLLLDSEADQLEPMQHVELKND